ncbi:MAG: Os1348 family NHLP clan protein [Thermosynechococcaceae cyanobacterium]
MSDFQTLVGRALSDENFAKSLVESPEATLREAGVEPSAEILEALQGIDLEGVKSLAAAFGDDKAA